LKILTIVGARPQFIKAAVVSRAIRDYNNRKSQVEIEEVIVHTGQHFDANMSTAFFDQLDIPRPAYNLGVAGLDHGAMTGRMLEGIETLIKQEEPDWVLVYGDTNSTLAGALAASKLHVSLAHVEAGLRSYNLAMPEEINRTLTDRVSTLLFCPTSTAVDNLKAEGYPFTLPKKRYQTIQNVGDVMYDATLYYRELAHQSISLDTWQLRDCEYVLCTLHRAENTDDPVRLENIFGALREIAEKYTLLLPLHPRTHKLIVNSGKQAWMDGIRVIEPVPYLEMQRLEMGAKIILTDSGGIQKEAYFHGVPCITLRDETEWVETVEMGCNQVVGADKRKIVQAFYNAQKPIRQITTPYGDGTASCKILEFMTMEHKSSYH
jgi:UDP-GlcNAc3NAcA epimerase